MTPINILVSLHRGYGLGDAVAMSAVLRHVRAARAHWNITYQAEEGKQVVGRDIVDYVIAYGDAYPVPYYDAEVQILLFETYYGWTDRPNTRVSSALHDRFGLNWNAEYGRYKVNVSDSVKRWAIDTVPSNAVAFHYQGNTAKDKKDLTHKQAEEVCNHIRDLGCAPYMIGDIPKGYDAEVNCAVIQHCRAFVGIDSGPSKCASATDTPALVVWTGHHPAQFHDPAPNTTHLVPVGYHGLKPVYNDERVVRWFEAHYNVLTYSDGNPVPEINKWLTEVLT